MRRRRLTVAVLRADDGGCRRGGGDRPGARAFFAFDSMRLFYVNVDMPAGVVPERTLAEAERAVKVLGETIGADELRAVAVYAG